MSSKIHLIYIFCIVVLVAFLTLSISKKKHDYKDVKSVTDTLVVYRIDTIVEYIPKYKEKKTTDTIYIPSNNKPLLPIHIEQKHYSMDGMYDAWISGYKPTMDSIKVYPKTIYSTITNDVTREVVLREWNLYTYMGFKQLSNEWLPSIGLIVKSPKNLMYGVEIGAIDGNMYYGLQFGYKIK